jgi:MoaA/NifB/PqqE/SkfB family radical SAM enzyme
MSSGIKNFFKWAKPLKKGVHHYRSGGTLEGHRVHLRIESNGSGLLIIDADKILYLNQTAAEIIKGFLDGKSDEEIEKWMVSRYRVRGDTVSDDIDSLKHTVKRFAEATDVDPVTYLTNKDISMFTTGFSAPHRMDLVLTYEKENLLRRFCYQSPKKTEILDFNQWKWVIDTLWNIGVPHILFSGGEPTRHENFVELVQYAEDVGVVTGLLTDGEKLKDTSYVDSLEKAGLDHIQITVESQKKEIHDSLIGDGMWEKTVKGMENALKTPLYCVAHTTFTKRNSDDIPGFVSFLKQKGVYAFAADALRKESVTQPTELSLSQDEIAEIIKRISDETRKSEISFVWYGLETSQEDRPSGMWEYSMCIEPNGDVSPCEFEYKSFGNIQKNDWKTIWEKAVKYNREKR